MKSAIFGSVAVAAIMMTASAPAWAQDVESHQGPYVGADMVGVSAPITYTGGKPDPDLSGAFAGITVGYNHQFDNNFVLGVRVSYAAGQLSACEDDGNFIDQCAWLRSLLTGEVVAGWSLGRFMPYVTAGLTQREAEISQTCVRRAVAFPVSPGSHCSLNGGDFGYERYATLDDTAPTYGAGIEYNATDQWAFDLSYRHTDFGRVITSLGNNGNAVPAPIPDTDPDQVVDAVYFGGRYRFN